MEKKIMDLLQEARAQLSSFVLNEDTDFTKALISGKIETKEHQEKKAGILDFLDLQFR